MMQFQAPKARPIPATGKTLQAPGSHPMLARSEARQAPKARPIPARGEAPCTGKIAARGLKARPISTPQMLIIGIQTILPQERTQFITKRMLAMMRLLFIDVSQQRIEIRRPNRERTITDLPGEIRDSLRLQPSRRRGLQLLHELRNRLFLALTNRKMDMIGNTPSPVTFASSISCDRREVSKQIGTDILVEQGQSIFGAEDHMNHNKGKRSWHSKNYRSVFQTSKSVTTQSRGFAPRWYRVAPLALAFVVMFICAATVLADHLPPSQISRTQPETAIGSIRLDHTSVQEVAQRFGKPNETKNYPDGTDSRRGERSYTWHIGDCKLRAWTWFQPGKESAITAVDV